MVRSLIQHSQRWFVILFIVGFGAYCLPWLINPGSSLTFGAYDLAEWASLHPVVRGSNPTLLTSLFLRLPLACFGIAAALIIWRQSPLKRVIFLLVVGIALLPPLEFFTQYRDDPNYQQQFALAVLTVLVGVGSLALRTPKWTQIVSVAVALSGGISGLLGLIQTYNLMRGFELATQVGWGGILFLAVTTVIGATMLFSAPPAPLKQTR